MKNKEAEENGVKEIDEEFSLCMSQQKTKKTTKLH